MLYIMIIHNNWLILSIFASFFFIGSELLYKFTECSNIQPELYVSIMWIIGGFIGLVYYLYNKFYKNRVSSTTFAKICIIASLIFFGNLLYWRSCNKGPNPGLTRGIFSGSLVILLAILSMFIFKQTLNIQQGIGISLIVLGTILIGLYSKT